MKDWILKAGLSLLGEIVEKYLTDELIESVEMKAKEYAYEKLKELAADTTWTEIDDMLVKKIGQVWGVGE